MGKKQLKTAKGRKISSTQWLFRHMNDPYVELAKQHNYRSRAAFKLIQIHKKYKIFSKNDKCIVDLGSAPGSWLQVIKEYCAVSDLKIIGIDLMEVQPLDGVVTLQADFTALDTINLLLESICMANVKTQEQQDIKFQTKLKSEKEGGGAIRPSAATYKIDVILSDMAPPACGNKQTDHIRIMQLSMEALNFAIKYLSKGGNFVTKILHGEGVKQMLTLAKEHFVQVELFKPESSYSNSSEMFIIGKCKKSHTRISDV